MTPELCSRYGTISAGGSAGTFASWASRRLPQGWRALSRLAGHGEPVALLIVNHHMTEMPGLEFLARAHELHPSAKRVLLVERDYSARSPVVQAMTLGQADYYLSKPWMLEPDLYRGVSEFLAEWARDQEAAFDLFHVIGGLDRPWHERAARAAHPLQRAVPVLRRGQPAGPPPAPGQGPGPGAAAGHDPA